MDDQQDPVTARPPEPGSESSAPEAGESDAVAKDQKPKKKKRNLKRGGNPDGPEPQVIRMFHGHENSQQQSETCGFRP